MSHSTSFGLLLIRGIVGFVLFYHGAQKLFGWFDGGGMDGFITAVAGLKLPGGVPPKIAAYAAAGAEFGGGILFMLGLATRVAAVPAAVTMGVAAFKVHGHAFSLAEKGMEYALLLMIVSIGLIFTGAGRFSVDGSFRRSKPAKPPSEKKR